MHIKSKLLALSATALLAMNVAHADELIVNGGFEGSTPGHIGYNVAVPGWSTTGYNFVYNATGADSPGAEGQWGNVSLWGPANGANNGLTASPNGGSFIANDGGSGIAPITQQVNGLVTGQQYTLSFYWGGAQQYRYDGPTTEQWIVSLGNETQSTAVLNNVEHGFTGWQKESMTFTAGSSSELLSFLAVGTPVGVPPFSLLDGVSMAAAVPEPDTWAMMALGMGTLGFAARRRKAKAAQAA
jgi:hypothetical protein